MGFSFALARLGHLLILVFKLLLFWCDRTAEFGGPPLFEPSLMFEGDIGHIKPQGSVHLHRRADQVSEDHECAHANESRQADGEQKPDKFNLLGAEVKAPHCSSAQTAAFALGKHSATLR